MRACVRPGSERSHDAREKKAGRPDTVAAVRAEWRGCVRAARASNEMVVVLPRVSAGVEGK